MKMEEITAKIKSENRNDSKRRMIGFGMLSKGKSVVYSIEEIPTQTANPSGDE